MWSFRFGFFRYPCIWNFSSRRVWHPPVSWQSLYPPYLRPSNDKVHLPPVIVIKLLSETIIFIVSAGKFFRTLSSCFGANGRCPANTEIQYQHIRRGRVQHKEAVFRINQFLPSTVSLYFGTGHNVRRPHDNLIVPRYGNNTRPSLVFGTMIA